MQPSQKRNELQLQTAPENQLAFSFELEAREAEDGSEAIAVCDVSATNEVNFASNLAATFISNSSPVSVPNPNDSEVSSRRVVTAVAANNG